MTQLYGYKGTEEFRYENERVEITPGIIYNDVYAPTLTLIVEVEINSYADIISVTDYWSKAPKNW